MITRMTAMRCWRTSADAKLSQKPLGPSGQFSGSERRNRNKARPRKTRGHILAHLKYLLRESRASRPVSKTKRPAQLWLYSDHAMSAALLLLRGSVPGTKAEATLRPSALARRRSSLEDPAICLSAGLDNRGIRGA